MSLLDKLTGAGQVKVPVHQFWASLYEMAAGEKTKADIMAAFNLQPGTDDETELDFLINKYNASADKPKFVESIHVLFMLAEYRLFGYHDKTTITDRINRLA